MFMPFLLVGFMFQLRMMMTDMLSFKKSLEKSSKTAVEAINNIRTVAGLRCEERVIGEYARALQGRYSIQFEFRQLNFSNFKAII